MPEHAVDSGVGSDLVVTHEASPGVLEVRLNRPDKRNALSSALLSALETALDIGDDIRVVVLTAAGPVFSAGVDIAALRGDEQDRVIDRQVKSVARTLAGLAVPTIAAVDWSCYGAALELVVACDGWVISPRTTFALPSIRMGLLYDPSTLATLQARFGPAAVRRLVLLQQPLRATDLAAVAVVADDAVENARTRALTIAADLAAAPTSLVRLTKSALRGLADGDEPSRWTDAHEASFSSEERRAAVATALQRQNSR